MATAPRSSISTVLLLIASIVRISHAGNGDHGRNVEDGDLCSWPACSCAPENLTIVCNFDATQSVRLTNESFKLDPKINQDARLRGIIQEIHLRGAKEIYVQNLSLVNIDVFFIKNVHNVEFQSKSCLNLKPNNLKLIVQNCDRLNLRTDSLQVPETGVVTVNISKCEFVNIESRTFSRVLSVHLVQINHLKLEKSAFHVDMKENKINTKIYLSKVFVPYFPDRTFVVSLSEIMIEDSEIQKIKTHAFNANEYYHIKINNTIIGSIEKEGFTYNSLITNFTFYNCTIKHMQTRAIEASSSCFKIQHSNLIDIEKGAIKSNSAIVTITDNTINTFGMELNNWNTFNIERNRFYIFDNNSIIAPYHFNNIPNEFTFINNSIDKIEKDSLRFIRDLPGSPMLNINYENIFFNKLCNCNIHHWLENMLGGNVTSMQNYVSTSYCNVNDEVLRCLNLTEVMTMKKFNKTLCEVSDIVCNTIQMKIDNKKMYEEQDEDFLYSILNNETKILIYILISVVICVIIICAMIAICKFVKRRGYCANVKNAVMPSNSSCFTFFDRLFNFNYGLDTTESVSRISLNNYPDNLILHERNEDNMTLINSTSMEDLVETVDKATQTLPEELTKELLESLREKLDDPDNYNEAREMIEHLYDLIKVEEYCNLNNNNDRTSHAAKDKEAENLYDVIQVPASPRGFQGKNKKIMVSVGTNTTTTPYNRQMALCQEYFQPQDHTMHLYSELSESKYSDTLSQMDLVKEVMSPNPLICLHAIEMSMSGSKANANGETSNPKDNLAPGPSGVLRSATQKSNKSNYSASSDSSASKMANRPLPEKPRAPP